MGGCRVMGRGAEIGVVMVDEHPIFLVGVGEVLRREPDFKVLARCGSGEEGLRAVRAHRADILLFGMQRPDKRALDVLREMKGEKLPTRVVLLVGELNDDELLEVAQLRPGGVVLKEMAPRLLVQCLRKVHSGESWIERTTTRRALENLLRRDSAGREMAERLTRREIEVMRKVVSGLRNKGIAAELGISEGTVKTHLHSLFEKLGLKSRAEMMVYWRERGM